MKTIHVRNVPDDLYKQLNRLAYAKNRSLSAQMIVMLSKSIGNEERHNQQVDILNSIQSRRFKVPAKVLSTLELLREDRGR
jgi:plasmid stability protein